MDYQWIECQLNKLVDVYRELYDKVELEIGEPATKDEILRLENEIGMELPMQLKNFLLNFSGYCDFCVFLSKQKDSQGEDEFPYMSFTISTDGVIHAENNRKDWQEECFPDNNNSYDKVWHNKLGIIYNEGDVIALDIGIDKINPPVVYLSHDGCKGHGYILGKDFNTFFEAFLKIGACGSDDCLMIPYCDNPYSGINPNCRNAIEYRKRIGLTI
ncbi:SMI1/KNR4 family protein [Anaerotignum propionicum]|uniref:SMI1/KNR4 family protein n=1 Tax=Anaerotignum propionicum TaxID=28446 RepID=UPI0021092BEC|nr:SMI1/KNR4 family protein [Anaerotignum propionicum]MCQ4936789.1 SMI1/KNR4 family protein [Anaerotignum propionicum]